jgi:hypothetical protein
VVEEFLPQRFVQPLDFAGRGGGTRFGPALPDAIFSADSFEQHLHRLRFVVASGELCPVIGQYFRRHAVSAHGRGERRAHLPPGGRAKYCCDHDEPGMVVNAGDQFAFPPVGQW